MFGERVSCSYITPPDSVTYEAYVRCSWIRNCVVKVALISRFTEAEVEITVFNSNFNIVATHKFTINNTSDMGKVEERVFEISQYAKSYFSMFHDLDL